MNKFYSLLLVVFYAGFAYSQADNCSGAPSLAVTATCGSPISGSTSGFTQSSLGCVGNADDDGWYKFVATATSHSITVTGSATYDAVIEVFSGACGSMISMSCMDNTFSGQAEAINLTGLSIGTTYYVRVYNYGSGSGSGSFTICLTNPPPPPANDACVNAISLTVNTTCSNVSGTTFGATQSSPGCSGTADDDVWYQFTANSYTQTITMTGSANLDGVVELFSGTCSALASITCMDNTFSGGIETINAVGLTPGQTYYLRVYDYYSGGGYPFSICVTGNPIGGGQPNDNPCSAIQLPPVTSSCNYLTFSTVGATNTGSGLAPTPASCVGGSGGSGGYLSTALDVWFAITVPANGNVYITPQPNQGTGYITDGSMALYSGSCGGLTQIACSSDYTLYPGSANDLLPYIAATGLTPGATIYLRYWKFNTGGGNFGLCVQSPTNDDCVNALYVCDINGYSGSTSAAYSPDRPGTGAGQMYANNETPAGVNQPDGTNTCGPFGYYPNCPAIVAGAFSSPAIDVNIENNSWIKFTAGAATANLRVTVGNCWVGNYPTGGIQMQIFSSTGCDNFVPVSSFREGSSTFTITANGLTLGNNYYLMVDGYAKDICNYTIQAIDGVALPEIVATPTAVCPGGTSILTAPTGATTYEWFPGGQTTQTIAVNPGSTQTYTCVAGGVCGQKQTLTKQVVVKTVPTVAINANAAIALCGAQTITLTASGANTYSWSTTNTTTTISTTPVTTTTYSVIGTAANGCSNTAVSIVTVNPIPTIGVTASSNTICTGQSTTLTATGGTSYTWTPGGTIASSITVSPTTNTIYNVTGSNTFGCTKTVSLQIVVNALPTVTSSSVTICNGKSGTLTANGASTYTWSTGTVASSITVNPTTTTNYTVTGTNANGCVNTAVGQVSVNALPNIQINSGSAISICNTQTITLTGSGGITYTWSTTSNAGNINVSPTSNTTYTLTGSSVAGCTNVAIATVSVNALPSITITGPTTLCLGNSTTLTGNGGTSYTWSPGGISTNITVSPTSNTSYSVTGTGANGCTAGTIATVTVNALPIIGVNSATVCNGSSATLTATGNSSTYLWNTGATSTAINPSPAVNTNYTVTGTSANSCTNSAVAQVTVIALPSVTVPSATICQNSTQILTASGANTYVWSTTQTGPSISVTPITTTTYSVKGTAVSTCTNVTTVTVTVNSIPVLSSTPLVAPSNCGSSTGSITNVSVSGSPTLTYTWTNGANVNVGSGTSLNNQPAGTYNLLVKDGNGCTSTFGPYSITNPGAPTAPTANATATSICVGQNINLNASSSATSPTYNWSGPNGFTSVTQNPALSNATTVMGGVYSVFITSAGCSGPATNVTIAVNALPTPNASSSQTVYCVGSAINLSASSASTYTWTGPGSFTSNSQTPSISNALLTSAGIYTLTVTNASGCQGTTTISIGVNANPVSTATANPASICAGQTINLNAGGGTSYNWVGPNGFTNSTQAPNITNATILNAGSYTVTVTAANTCTSSSVATVSVNPLPTFTSSVNSANICNGAIIQFNAGSNINTYSWVGPNSFSVNASANPSIPVASVSNSGTYTVSANSGSCIATQTIAVNVYAPVTLTATASNTSICNGSSLQLLGNGGSTYLWNGPGSFSSTSQSPQINNVTPAANGIYTLSILDGNNCPGTQTLAIVINANPTATASANPNIICVGSTINLISGGGTTYSWLGPNGFTNATQNPAILNAGSTNVGIYTVTVTDGNLCSATATTAVNVITLPTFTMSTNANDICFGGTIQFNAGPNPYNYSWTGPNSFSVTNNPSPSLTNATPLNSGTYTVTSSAGSCSFTQTLSVNVYPQLIVNAAAASYTVCAGTTATLTGTGGGTYSWAGPNNFSNNTQNPQIPFIQQNGAGIYTLTVTDNTTNCTETDTVKLSVSPAPTLVSTLGDSTCYGQQLQLNANFGNGASVNWYTDAGLTNLVQANSNTYQTTPTTNGTYTYYVQGVVGSCKSSVAMVSGAFYNITAIASADIYVGDAPLTVNFTGSNSAGVTSTDNFNWTFGDNTNSNVINPNHIFNSESTYTVILTVIDIESGCLDTATVIIKVEDDLTVVVPNVFTPNADGTNDVFHVKIKGAKTAEGFIYNRWGQLLYSWDALNTSWDGIAANGEKCPDATYYYLIKVIDKKDKEHLFPGFALLVR